MDKEMKRALEQKLNRLGEQWFALGKIGNEGVRKRLELEIAETLFQCFVPGYSGTDSTLRAWEENLLAAISYFWSEKFQNFNPEKGTLCAYVTFHLKKLKVKAYYADFDGKPETIIEDNGKPKKVKVPYLSTETPIAGDGEKPLYIGDMFATSEQAEDAIIWDWFKMDQNLLEYFLLMSSLDQRLEKKQNNDRRRRYFTLFFTDAILYILDSTGVVQCLRQHERDVLHTMELPFVDHLKVRPCQTLDEMEETPLKRIEELIPHPKQPGPTELPLLEEVYRVYLGVAKSRVSEMMTAYRSFVEQQLVWAERPI